MYTYTHVDTIFDEVYRIVYTCSLGTTNSEERLKLQNHKSLSFSYKAHPLTRRSCEAGDGWKECREITRSQVNPTPPPPPLPHSRHQRRRPWWKGPAYLVPTLLSISPYFSFLYYRIFSTGFLCRHHHQRRKKRGWSLCKISWWNWEVYFSPSVTSWGPWLVRPHHGRQLA